MNPKKPLPRWGRGWGGGRDKSFPQKRQFGRKSTVAGVVGGAVFLTLVDRMSRYLICARLEKKTADGVDAAMIEALRKQVVHSITPDWGKEFARHAVVAEALGVKIYSDTLKILYKEQC